MSYVTYLENDYVVCGIIRVVAAGATDMYVGCKTVLS